MNRKELQTKKMVETMRRIEKKERHIKEGKPYLIGGLVALIPGSLFSSSPTYPLLLLIGLGLYGAGHFSLFLDKRLLKFQNKHLSGS